MAKDKQPLDIVYWNKKEVKDYVGWKGDSTLYRAIKSEGFPQPVKLGRNNRWLKHEVAEWMSKLPRAEIAKGEGNSD